MPAPIQTLTLAHATRVSAADEFALRIGEPLIDAVGVSGRTVGQDIEVVEVAAAVLTTERH